MNGIQVDIICAQPLQALVHLIQDFFPGQPPAVAALSRGKVDLCGQHNFIPKRFDAHSHGFLIISGATVRIGAGIAFGGVEKRVAHVIRRLDFFRRLGLFQRRAKGVAEAHAA